VNAAAESRGGRRATRLELLLAFVLACAASLAFATKAVQQDDWAYLRVADHLRTDPAHVFEQTTLYKGMPIDVASGVPHGPVWPLALAIARAPLFGTHTLWVAHALSALCHGLAALGIAALAARFGARPIGTALLYALSATAWPLASNVMTDVPMVGLFCAALALAARGIERGAGFELGAAGVLAALAALTRYHGLAVFPMLLLSGFVFAAPRWRNFVPLLVGIALVAAYFAWTRVLLGVTDAQRASGVLLAIEHIDRSTAGLATVATIGVCALGGLCIGLCGLSGLVRSARSAPLSALGLVFGLGAGLYLAYGPAAERSVQPSGVNATLQWGSLALGGALLGYAAAVVVRWIVALRGGGFASLRVERYGAALYGACWLLGFALAATVSVPFGCARYVLPALPAVALLLGRAASQWCGPRLAVVGVGSGVLATAALGLLAAEADHRAAAVYPDVAAQVRVRRGAEGAWNEGKLWIWGDLGFRWYLEEAQLGSVLAGTSNEPRSGDRVLKSAVCTSSPDDGKSGDYKLQPQLIRRLRAAEELHFKDDWPVRVHNTYAPAGLYHADAGLLPFAFSTAEHDVIHVWSVEDHNELLAQFATAEKESYSKRVAKGGNLRVERYLAAEDEDQKLALAFAFPGRVTWRDVAIPERSELVFLLAEHARLAKYAEPGPGSITRVRVDGTVVFERQLDSRRHSGDGGWHACRVDLSAHAGRTVALTFEVGAQPPPPGAPPESAEYVLVGIAEPALQAAR
jgi:hypothetical protein